MEDSNEVEEASERSFFSEKDQILEVIQSLSKNMSQNVLEDKFEHIKRILDRYQEQPQLIGPHTEELLKPLNDTMTKYVEDHKELDNHIHTVCKIVQILCKVRGAKQCSKYLPHEVHHLEPCIAFLKRMDPNLYSMWEIQYVMLLWLSTLCLIPFDLSSLDSSNSSKQLVNDLIETAKVYMSSSGPSREAAAMCVSSLLTRPDMQSNFLNDYLVWAVNTLDDQLKSRNPQSQFLYLGCLHSLSQIFKKGHREKLLSLVELVLQSVSNVFEKAELMSERKYVAKLLQRLGMTLLPVREAPWRYQRGKRSLNFLSSHTNVVGNSIDSSVEVDDDDSWDVSPLLEDIIDKLLQFLGDKDTIVRWSSAKGIGRIAMRLPKSFGDEIVNAIIGMFENDEDDCRWHGGCLALAELTRRGLLLPEKLPEVVPLVANALHFDILKGQHGIGSHVRDSASYVCWSFARAYTPAVMSPFVKDLSVSMLTAILFDREINCRRAAAAAFQENVGRQGNENFPNGIDIITIADFFSVGNRQACYLDLAPQIAAFDCRFFTAFVDHLVEYKLHHWDREIRELAAQSMSRFLLCINSDFDYDSLISKLVGDVDNVSLAVRHGSLLGLGRVVLTLSLRGCRISEHARQSMVCLILDIEKKRIFRGRGGEMIREAVCILIESLAQSGAFDSPKAHVSVVEFLNEQLRQPHLSVQCAAQSALRHCLFIFFGDKSKGDPSERLQKLTILKYVEGLSTEQNVAATRGYAMGLGALCSRLILRPVGNLERLLSTLARFGNSSMRISGEYDAETCKLCIESAIEIFEKIHLHCEFDEKYLDQFLKIFLNGCQDYNVDKRGDTGSWSRIAALRSLERFIICLSSSYGNCSVVESCYGILGGISSKLPCEQIFSPSSIGGRAGENMKWMSLGRSGGEYKTFILVGFNCEIRSKSIILSEGWICDIYASILKQLAEKLNNVREVAGHTLCNISFVRKACNDRNSVDLFFDALLEETKSKGSSVDWSSPEQSFSVVCKALTNSQFVISTLEGLIVSVGGLTESVSREATKALVELRHLPGFPQIFQSIVNSLLVLFERKFQDERIVLPLLKTIDALYRNGLFQHLKPAAISQWNIDLHSLLKRQLSCSTNVAKIISIIDVVVMLLSGTDGTQEWFTHASLLVNLLTHKYPRVRKYASEQLYLILIGCTTIEGSSLSRAIDFLMQIQWETASREDLTEEKQSLCSLLGVECFKASASRQAKPQKKTDELDSYEALVREAGY